MTPLAELKVIAGRYLKIRGEWVGVFEKKTQKWLNIIHSSAAKEFKMLETMWG